MHVIKIKSARLRYDPSFSWPWLLEVQCERGIHTLEFPSRRDAVTFCHNKGWTYTEETKSAIQ